MQRCWPCYVRYWRSRAGRSRLRDLERLEVLDAGGAGIRDLTGLEFASNLRILRIADNRICHLSPILSLTAVEELDDLEENRITDLSPLAALGDLVEVILCDNRVEDIAPLAGMHRLKILDLGDNRIADLSPLEGMGQLVQLIVPENRITDLSPIQNHTMLTSLSASYNSSPGPGSPQDAHPAKISHGSPPPQSAPWSRSVNSSV